ncbi:tetratricopeptide repeat protein [Pukyongiella litopenaei]|uniref:Tetratricopeptide repeat protein n=2 Tax=Pukyongiella litopenaei TaxID=2605946 RepID=A0A2S0MRI3_9RHOB|nr:tetratricopeptide repeat protein [Pukyongiella litopenaei]
MPHMFYQTTAAALLTLSLALPAPVLAQSGSGAYLAGRHAAFVSDFANGDRYYARALSYDRDNPSLMESVVVSRLALGEVNKAVPIAQRMEELGLQSQPAHMTVVADLAARGEYEAILSRDPETVGVGPLVDGLIAAWAHLGAGSVAQALEQFDKVAEDDGLRNFALYHKALALASVGDFEGAEAIFAADEDGMMVSGRAAIARAEILSQLERDGDALAMLDRVFSNTTDPSLADIVARLQAGEALPFTQVRDVRDGMAEIFFAIGQALRREASPDYVLVYVRVASFLRPDHIDAQLLGAELLDGMGQYDLAVETYKKIPTDSPDYYAAELGRADALRRADKVNAAIEVLEKLAREHPELAIVHSSLGDMLRQQENYGEAARAYDRAVDLTEADDPSMWFLLYARGICHERERNWEQAESDFRTALELNPDQPQVLNYLGYSLVEKQIKLDEALGMIERAVAARPDSGYIVDSLGWVLYRLGRYDEAVGHMETAVSLMPVDPVVNDHLGDVYWAVGRKREAEFQWKRALSFIKPDDTDGEADPDRIRSKLEIGLDAVLAGEGAEPLKVANGSD